jgi:hypothetical protein
LSLSHANLSRPTAFKGKNSADDETVTSVTTETFYPRLGYIPLRDEFFGKERTIIMTKQLAM